MPKSEPGNKLVSYVCGGCESRIYYVQDKGRPEKCPNCEYQYGTRKKYDIPPVIKLNLNELGG